MAFLAFDRRYLVTISRFIRSRLRGVRREFLMTMNKRRCFVFAALMAVPVALIGQDKSPAQSAPPANPITASEKGLYSFVSGAVVSAAQKMPEENYTFKPTPEVRSFGQLVGHVADANYMFCSQASGEPNPSKNIEKTKTSKADLVAAVKDRKTQR